MTNFAFRSYCKDDFDACIDIFDANCPEFLAPVERQDYEEYLEYPPKSYEVCELDGQVVAAFGLDGDSKIEKRLHWIMIDTKAQGMGLGARIMERVIHLGRKSNTRTVGIATTQIVKPFFEKYGATAILTTKDGWALGYDRVDMVLPL